MHGTRFAGMVAALAALASPTGMTSAEQSVDWVTRSNEHSRLVLEVAARFFPERAASLGVDGLDEEIFDLEAEIYERTRAANEELLAELRARHGSETHRQVAQDLEILIKTTEDGIRSAALQREHLLPYFNLSETVFWGVRSLIDPQIPSERYPAAVVRLRKYAGLAGGLRPIAELAKERTRERFEVEGLLGPYRGEVEQDLERSATFIQGIRQLLESAELEGWSEPYETLASQLAAYNEWIRAEILPRSRPDFRLPPALYEDALRNWGVEAAPEELIRMATQGYQEIRNEMRALAPLVAGEKGYDSNDYREVLRRLKEEQIRGDELLATYRARLVDIERIIVSESLVTLPERNAGIRIGSEAETAAQPAPHLDVPRLIGNTGEYPEFVLPMLKRDEDGGWQRTDETYQANAWTLTAHEARPGHELQYSSMVERGVSVARAIFAFNSANVEGWALYAEAIIKPHMPLDAQLVSLQHRLLRAARMFLDPLLNLGRITPQEAKRLLIEEVLVGEESAQNEIERYTYRMPGQATAYYYGYGKLLALRTETELALREEFDQLAFHDFILAQGLLPAEILKHAVMEEFGSVRKRASAATVVVGE